MDGYCVKCKTRRDMKNHREIEMQNGRVAVQGTCKQCGAGMYRILPAKAA